MYVNWKHFPHNIITMWGTRWCSWSRHCATSRKVTGSIPNSVNGIFHGQSFWLHCGPGVDSASNRKEYWCVCVCVCVWLLLLLLLGVRGKPRMYCSLLAYCTGVVVVVVV
jgi:hypothetical protein